jgi:hypothetical protein
MRGRPAAADEGHVMTPTLHSQHDQLEELFATASGRFGRQILTIAWPDPETAPPRSTTVGRMRARLSAGGYRIDPSVVANAIVDRVGAGGLATGV